MMKLQSATDLYRLIDPGLLILGSISQLEIPLQIQCFCSIAVGTRIGTTLISNYLSVKWRIETDTKKEELHQRDVLLINFWMIDEDDI